MLDTRDRMAGNMQPARDPSRHASHEESRAPISGSNPRVGKVEPAAALQVSLKDFLRNTPFDANDPFALGDMLGALVAHGYDRAPFLPLPGHGRTLARWRALAQVAACDLGLVKLYEGHTDALAILAELHGPTPPEASRWGVWAAEPPDARVEARRAGAPNDRGLVSLTGTKSWCSGAGVVSHALVTAWLDDEPVLVAVSLDEPSVTVDASKWRAVGMQATASADVTFDDTPATLVGAAHDYVQRAGFWQGGAGIAACWYGAAAQIGHVLREACGQRADEHRWAHLGSVDVALSGASAVLREAAAWIDAHPRVDAQREAMRARLIVEDAATAVMQHATRTLGAGPLCRDARFARALADLPVFLRQSHAERDLAALGKTLVERDRRDKTDTKRTDGMSSCGDTSWSL